MDRSVKMRAKNVIRRTLWFQSYKSRKYFLDKKQRFDKLLPDEKYSSERICVQKGSKVDQLVRMLSMIQIKLRPDARFQNWIDTGLYVCRLDNMTDNIPPNYEWIIKYSFEDLEKNYCLQENEVSLNNLRLLNAVSKYVDHIVYEFDSLIKKEDNNAGNLKKGLSYFKRMRNCPAESLEEAFQRILFWSSLFWQTQHRLIGLGRLDKILSELPLPHNEEYTITLICDFYNEIHRYYAYKSNAVALGDTGQIIVLGGREPDGSYFHNQLTSLFIESLYRHNLPEPKTLLRVSGNMPYELLNLAVRCLSTGIGCPLLSNDDVIIPALEKFGYTYEDACNYVTSACWEPLVYGKSLEKNNMCDINYAEASVEMYKDATFTDVNSFDELFSLYLEKLKAEIKEKLSNLDRVRWEADPLMTLFTQGCLLSGKDISNGGAVYNNYGILTVGLANAVNSLLNIKRMVFGNNASSTLAEFQKAGKENYNGFEKLQVELTEHEFYGRDDTEVIDIVHQITKCMYQECSGYRNQFGGKLKWGLSSSNYGELGKITEATLDGRKEGTPLAVHISAPKGVSYTELIGFAGKINYDGQRANGNVVDLFLSPDFIQKNFEKFTAFIELSIKAGFFQMQMNVVSSKALLDAKAHPEQAPDIIVRVWGFSAYFKDLPEEYQNLLIKRALESEETV